MAGRELFLTVQGYKFSSLLLFFVLALDMYYVRMTAERDHTCQEQTCRGLLCRICFLPCTSTYWTIIHIHNGQMAGVWDVSLQQSLYSQPVKSVSIKARVNWNAKWWQMTVWWPAGLMAFSVQVKLVKLTLWHNSQIAEYFVATMK